MTCEFQVTDGVLVAAVDALKRSWAVGYSAQANTFSMLNTSYS